MAGLVVVVEWFANVPSVVEVDFGQSFSLEAVALRSLEGVSTAG